METQNTSHSGDTLLSDHLSRKELKQDKIKETLEHSAEAVFSHGQMVLAILVVVLLVAASYAGWTVYHDRKTLEATNALDDAMKAYNGRVGPSSEPLGPGELSYSDDSARAQDALQKLDFVAKKYPNTEPGQRARFYQALCLEDLQRHSQALDELKHISSGGDKELVSMAQYQTALIYARTGKPDDAVKILRALADKGAVFTPRPLVLLELATVLRQNHPQEAVGVYQQIKKEFPNTSISGEADRGLEAIAPQS
ncbi:MAG: hypothetical protein NVS9B4_10530 [Candidatus Acidiferrum sp.]